MRLFGLEEDELYIICDFNQNPYLSRSDKFNYNIFIAFNAYNKILRPKMLSLRIVDTDALTDTYLDYEEIIFPDFDYSTYWILRESGLYSYRRLHNSASHHNYSSRRVS